MPNGPPHFRASEGEFAVDYRSHNGVIRLGDGDALIETQWSNAGTGAIHAYHDRGSQVAVARGARSIEEVTATVFERADFSSRVRTPRNGEIALWRSSAGYAAAVHIRRVVAVPESDHGAVLEASYRVLTDGSHDFSPPQEPEVANLQRAISEALEAFGALEDLDFEQPLGSAGIGHNNPPPDLKLVKEDFSSIAEDLRAAMQRPRDESQLRKLQLSVTPLLEPLGAAILNRQLLIREGFYRQIGALTATMLVGLAAWLLFMGKLEHVDIALRALTTRLFGWP